MRVAVGLDPFLFPTAIKWWHCSSKRNVQLLVTLKTLLFLFALSVRSCIAPSRCLLSIVLFSVNQQPCYLRLIR